MKIDTFESKSTVVITATLEVIQIEPNLSVFSTTISSKKPKSTGTFHLSKAQTARNFNEQGFVDDKNLELLKAGKKHQNSEFCVIPSDIQEELRTSGWNAAIYNSKDDSKFDFSYPFDSIKKQGSVDPDTIVKFDFSSHMLFDRHGDPLPVAVPFDYMSHGGISEDRFDLVKLATHLLSRKDIVIHATNGYKHDVKYDEVATTVEEAIAEIPYYNSERGRAKTVYFTWQPNKADYCRMWTECLKTKKYPSTCMHQAIFDLDILGFKSSGAALFDNFFESKRDHRNDDDY